MAFLFSDSFDFYTVAGNSEFNQGGWTSWFRMSISDTTTRFGVGKSAYNFDTVATLGKTFSTNTSNTIFLTLSYRNDNVAVGSNDTSLYITFGDGAAEQCSIYFIRNGSIQLRRGATILGTYTSAFADKEWNNFQFKIKIDPTVGTFSFRQNGSSTDTYAITGLNTQQTANSFANYILCTMQTSPNYLEDFYYFDDSGSAPNDWVGDQRCYALTMTADTAQKDFTPQGSANNYANVGKFAPNTSTYNYSSTVGNEDLFDITNLSVTPTSITSVVVKTVMQKSDSAARNGQPVILSNVTSSTGTDEVLSTSWSGYLSNWSVDPDTSAAWTASGVNNLQVGYKVSA